MLPGGRSNQMVELDRELLVSLFVLLMRRTFAGVKGSLILYVWQQVLPLEEGNQHQEVGRGAQVRPLCRCCVSDQSFTLIVRHRTLPSIFRLVLRDQSFDSQEHKKECCELEESWLQAAVGPNQLGQLHLVHSELAIEHDFDIDHMILFGSIFGTRQGELFGAPEFLEEVF